MHPLIRHALALTVLVGASMPALADELAEPVTQPALEARVKDFLQAFIDPDQTPEQQARFFVEGADYYRFGPTNRRDIAADIRRYAKRWPLRSYRLLDIEYLQYDPASDDVFVSYVIEYEVADSSRNVQGRATYGVGIADIHTDPKIGLIMERIDSSGD